ncbi:hypothetical protein HMPREF0758_0122 [Serratia odorifera DSM 4582]|jgi:hypothetical protein|uniref:Uncharacterized protein n=1 Tax=Serratia odorifera DSM 4582 TaxID=667129 RepID=D4DW22_SEROD|nr:hypothetical protein HMPREF0758_0122 [Serratia odorifera DSM 4582]
MLIFHPAQWLTSRYLAVRRDILPPATHTSRQKMPGMGAFHPQ